MAGTLGVPTVRLVSFGFSPEDVTRNAECPLVMLEQVKKWQGRVLSFAAVFQRMHTLRLYTWVAGFFYMWRCTAVGIVFYCLQQALVCLFS